MKIKPSAFQFVDDLFVPPREEQVRRALQKILNLVQLEANGWDRGNGTLGATYRIQPVLPVPDDALNLNPIYGWNMTLTRFVQLALDDEALMRTNRTEEHIEDSPLLGLADELEVALRRVRKAIERGGLDKHAP